MAQLLVMYPDVSAAMQQAMEARLRRWRLRRCVNTVRKINKATKLLSAAGAQSALRRVTAEAGFAGAEPPAAAAEADAAAEAAADGADGGTTTPPEGGGARACPQTIASPVKKPARSAARRIVGRCVPPLVGSASRVAPADGHEAKGTPPKQPLAAACNNTNSIEEALAVHKRESSLRDMRVSREPAAGAGAMPRRSSTQPLRRVNSFPTTTLPERDGPPEAAAPVVPKPPMTSTSVLGSSWRAPQGEASRVEAPPAEDEPPSAAAAEASRST